MPPPGGVMVDPLIGRKLGPYEIRARLGSGGMGAVYEGVHEVLQQVRAIKVMSAHLANHASFVSLFRREAMLAAKLAHPNIVQIFDVSEQENLHYIVMEHLQGRLLRDAMRGEGQIPVGRVLAILQQLAEALDFAHSQHVSHRDVKPANVFLDAADHLTLVDFGIARAADGTHLTITNGIGTPEYMAPEVFDEEIVGADADAFTLGVGTDLYALGVVAYELFTGRVPFTGRTPQSIAFAQVHRAPSPVRMLRPDLPEGLEQVIQRQLSKRPSARYSRAVDFVRALSVAIHESSLDVRMRAALDSGDLDQAASLLADLDARDPAAPALVSLRAELLEQQRRAVRTRVVERLDADDRDAALDLIEQLRALGDPDLALLERIVRTGSAAAPPPGAAPTAQVAPSADRETSAPTVPAPVATAPAPAAATVATVKPTPVPPSPSAPVPRPPARRDSTPARVTPVPVPPQSRTERQPSGAAAASGTSAAAPRTPASPDDTPTSAVLLEPVGGARQKHLGVAALAVVAVALVGVLVLLRPWSGMAGTSADGAAGAEPTTPVTTVAASAPAPTPAAAPGTPAPAAAPQSQATSAPVAAPATATPQLPTSVPQTATPAPAQRLAEAEAVLASGDSGRALELLQAVKQTDPAAPGLTDATYRASIAHGKRLLDAGELDSSWAMYAQALDIRPDDPAAKDGQKQIVLAKNWRTMEATWGTDDDAALGAAQEIANIDLNYRDTRDKLYALLIARADRLLAAGDRASAFLVLMQALEARPDAPEARARLQTYTPTPVPYVPPTAAPRVVPAQQPQEQQSQPAPAQPAPVQPAPVQPAPAPTSAPAPAPAPKPVQPAGTPIRR